MKFSTKLLGCTAVACAMAGSAMAAQPPAKNLLGPNVKHLVIIYQENHSFDNLYGGWDAIEGQTVNGRGNAGSDKTIQVRQDNTTPYSCLLQNDVNLTSPPLPADCTDTSTGTPFASHFTNNPFSIETYLPKDARTCPQPGVFAPNGLTPVCPAS